MAQSLANFDAALKDFYGPGLRNAINTSNPVLTEVTRDEENVQGRKAIWSLQSGRSGSTGARAEGGTLPTADRQRYLAPEDTLAYLYHTIKVSGQAKHLTKGDRGSFARALEAEIKGAERDLKNEVAREMFNQVKTINSALVNGVIATVNGVGSSPTFALDDDGDALDPSIMRHFFVGMPVDFVTPGTGAITRSTTITAIDFDNKTITVATGTSILDNDYVVRGGNYAAGETEINGLRHLIGTSNYAGITASSNPVWNSVVLGSSTTGISEEIIERGVEKVETDGNGSTPTLFLTEHSQRRKLASVLQSQKRYEGRQTTLKAGWKGLDVAGGTLVVDRYCPTSKLFSLTPSDLGWFVGLDWTWDDDDRPGQFLYKALDDTDAVQARFKGYVNLEAYVRNSHAVTTLKVPTFA